MGHPIQSQSGTTMKVGGVSYTITCDGARYLTAGADELCDWTADVGDGVAIAVRAVDGTPLRADTLYLDGDFGQACDVAWALDLLHRNGETPPC
jgi:hypothetical protein